MFGRKQAIDDTELKKKIWGIGFELNWFDILKIFRPNFEYHGQKNPIIHYNRADLRTKREHIRSAVEDFRYILAKLEDGIENENDKLFCDLVRSRCGDFELVLNMLDLIIGDDVSRIDNQGIISNTLRTKYMDDFDFSAWALRLTKSTPSEAMRNEHTEGTPMSYTKRREDLMLKRMNYFKGLFPHYLKDSLSGMDFIGIKCIETLGLAFKHLEKYAKLPRNDRYRKLFYGYDHYDGVDISAKFNPSYGLLRIFVPWVYRNNGLNLVTKVGEIINSEARLRMNDFNLVNLLIKKNPHHNALCYILPWVANSLDRSAFLGVQALNRVRILGEEAVPQPYQYLALCYAYDGWEFISIEDDLRNRLAAQYTPRRAAQLAREYTESAFWGATSTDGESGYAFWPAAAEFYGFNYIIAKMSGEQSGSSEIIVPKFGGFSFQEQGMIYNSFSQRRHPKLDLFPFWPQEIPLHSLDDPVELIAKMLLSKG